LSVRVCYDNIRFRLKSSEKIKAFLVGVIKGRNRIPGDVVFIFAKDRTVRKINREFLKHDYNTDVISFSNNENDIINGEVYISVDTVMRNSAKYGTSFYEEIIRVMIHGTLHLLGYTDGSSENRKIMFDFQEELVKEIKRII